MAAAGIGGAAFATKKTDDPKVICCGECKPGDDCLRKRQVIGDVPKDLKITCCGNCLEKCGGKNASCCEVG